MSSRRGGAFLERRRLDGSEIMALDEARDQGVIRGTRNNRVLAPNPSLQIAYAEQWDGLDKWASAHARPKGQACSRRRLNHRDEGKRRPVTAGLDRV